MKNLVEKNLKLKRKVLVVDDEEIGRDNFANLIDDRYQVLFAENGIEALKVIKDNADTLSLILLDLMMPNMDGYQVLDTLKGDEALCNIPVVVLPTDEESGVKSIKKGAVDFIPKSYTSKEIINARIDRIIQLYESKVLLASTKNDPVSGLLTREYFMKYIDMIDSYAPEKDYDMIAINITKFRAINEIHGRTYGSNLLKQVGESIKKYVEHHKGIACRSYGDTYFIYVPHQENPNELLWEIHVQLRESLQDVSSRMRMGIYSHVDKHIPPSKRADRAMLACNSLKGNYNASVAHYDSTMVEREAYDEKLLTDLERALDEKQFIVYYQPKFKIQGEKVCLASAEALIRWKHPELGIINPSLFIPVLEQNGMIQKLDKYIWQEAAHQAYEWKEKYDVSVPVSVNVSRIDMLESNFVENLTRVVREAGISPSDYIIEINESVYTKDTEKAIDIVKQLRDLGFKIVMDDFGTGYSSLNMISSLPFDSLKLDATFVKHIHENQKDRRMVEIIMEIAKLLNVEVIAEGVEYEEQFELLKKIGVDKIQGYYFSKPVEAGVFESFIEGIS